MNFSFLDDDVLKDFFGKIAGGTNPADAPRSTWTDFNFVKQIHTD